MAKTKPVSIISDSPEKASGLFGFNAYARTIAGLIANKKNETPVVIGIFGPWGSGKTTLMETIISELDKNEYQDREIYRGCKVVRFQAWKYTKEEEILVALIEEIFKSMKQSGFFNACKAEIEKLAKKIPNMAAMISGLLTGKDISELFSGLEYKKRLGFYDTFQEFFDRLIWDYLKWRPKSVCSEKTDDRENVLVIFIDDLDRCPKDRILHVLETIKLFMDKSGCIFVIGAANDIIEKALEERYGKEDAAKFMDKIVQVTFNLPKKPETDFDQFIERMQVENKAIISNYLDLIIPALKNNPRNVKRFLNNLSLQEALLKNRSVELDFKHIMLWNIIDYSYPALASDLRDNPANLEELRNVINRIESAVQDKDRWEVSEEILNINNIPQTFRPYVKNKVMCGIVKNFTLAAPQLNQLVTLTKIVESALEVKEKEKEKETIQTDFDKMVEVPSGEFLYGDDKQTEKIEKPFLIDVYPVTNAQFAKFIKQGGYENEVYWSKEGWEWKRKSSIIEPRLWKDKKWNQPDYPVVGVSFYEAEAYAKWADKRLPTEKEWERAARGTDGRIYPWGNEFDKDKCNSEESGIGKTTKVTKYPGGISPVGCYDMAGNVWEWTDSWFDKDKVQKVLRGGSWSIDHSNIRCAGRFGYFPDDWFHVMGFRCIRT